MIIEHGDDLKMFLKVSEAIQLKIDFKGMFIFDPKRKVAVLGYGKYKGVPLAEVPVSYFKWIIDTDGFNADTKKIASEACRGIFLSIKSRNSNGISDVYKSCFMRNAVRITVESS